MSQVYVPGPAYIWIGAAAAVDGGDVTFHFLGQTVGDLSMSLMADFEDVHIDQAGPRIPYDVQFLGIEAFMGGTLIKYNESVWQLLAARIAGGTFGAHGSTDIGTLLRTERRYFEVYVSAPYAAKAAFSTQPVGFRFLCCYLHGGADASISVQAKRQRFQIRCLPYFAENGSGSAIVFTNVVPSGLPAVN